MARPRRLRKGMGVCLLALVGLYVFGFGVFLAVLPKPVAGVPDVDGLAVFTGGEGRVRTALDMVGDGFGGPVLVSGVYPAVHVRELEGAGALAPHERDRVMLDKASASTWDNIENTLRWADVWGLKHVGVVTSTYHAPRVELLAWAHGAAGRLTVVPVQPQRSHLNDMLWEYTKLWGAFALVAERKIISLF